MAYDSPYTGRSSRPLNPVLSLLLGFNQGNEQGRQRKQAHDAAEEARRLQIDAANRTAAHLQAQDAHLQRQDELGASRNQLQAMRTAAYTANLTTKNKAGAQKSILAAYQSGDDPQIIAGMRDGYKNTFGEEFLPGSPPVAVPPETTLSVDGAAASFSPPDSGPPTVAPPPLTLPTAAAPIPLSPLLATPYRGKVTTPYQQERLAQQQEVITNTGKRTDAGIANQDANAENRFEDGLIARRQDAATQPIGFQGNFAENANAYAGKHPGWQIPFPAVPGKIPAGAQPIAGPSRNPDRLGLPLNAAPAFALTPSQENQRAAAELSRVTAGQKPELLANTTANTQSTIATRATDTELKRQAQIQKVKEDRIRDDISRGHLTVAQMNAESTRIRTQADTEATYFRIGKGPNGKPIDPDKIPGSLAAYDVKIAQEKAKAATARKPTGMNKTPATADAMVAADAADAAANSLKVAQQGLAEAHGFKPNPNAAKGGWVKKTGKVDMARVPAPDSLFNPLLPTITGQSGKIVPLPNLPAGGASMKLPSGHTVPIIGRMTPSPSPSTQRKADAVPGVKMRPPQIRRKTMAELDAMTPAQKVANLARLAGMAKGHK